MTIATALAPLWPQKASANADMQSYAAALVQYFNSLKSGLEPFVAAEGQQIADVIDHQTRAVLKRRTACFPNLALPALVRYELPRYAGMSDTGASFLFDVKKFFGLAGNVKLVDSVQIVFTEATIEDVTLDELRLALSPECEFLKPLILEGQAVSLFGRKATLVRSIVRAKVTIVMSFGSERDASARIEDLGKLLPGGASSVMPVDATIEAKLGEKTQKRVMLQAEGPVPVAFRPTHIPKRLLGPEPPTQMIQFDDSDQIQMQVQEDAINAWLRGLK